MNDLMTDAGWIKANALIQEKYGKSLSYRAIKLLSEKDSESKTAFYSAGDDLIIPLKLKDYNLGDIIVSRGSVLDSQQKEEITDLVKFLIEPKLYNIQLQKYENNIMKSKSQTLSLVDDGEEIVALYSTEKASRKTLSQVILLKSHTELNRNKVALKIHEMTERNLFVHLDDIAATLTSKEDFKSLTDITIYIDDIERLSNKTIQLLHNYMDNTSDDGPLILVGSNLSVEAIQEKNWSEALKKDLMGFYFDIDRVPLSQQTSEEILELLFFDLDLSMT